MRKAAHIVLYVLVVFLFQEVVFRVCFPLPEVPEFNRSDFTPKPDNVEAIAPIRYEKKTFQSYPDTIAEFVHALNGYGFRDKDWCVKKPVGKKRVMFIGDSFTEGAMVSEGETIPDVFGELADTDQYEVMNLGVAGSGLPEYALLTASAVPLFKPDYLFLVLFSNDISRRTPKIPANITYTARNKYIPRLVELVKLMNKGEPLPFRWKKATSLMPAVPDPANLWTVHEAKFSKHVDSEFAKHMKEGHFNTFRINYVMAEEKYLKVYTDLEPYLKWTSNFANYYGAQLVVCYIPSREQVTQYYYPFDLPTCQILCPDSMDLTTPEYNIHQKELKRACDILNVQFIDLTEPIKKEEEKGNHLYWNYDDHLRAKGYQLVGEAVFEEWVHNTEP